MTGTLKLAQKECDAAFARMHQHAAKARERLASQREQEASISQPLFIRGMDELMRAMPNHIARSSLFAPVARGPKKLHNETPIITRSDVLMTYTGEQLDEAQADVALQLMYEARQAPLGMPVKINRAAFLRAMGRSTGKHDYEWLHRAMKAFTKATVIIEARKPDGSAKYRIGHTKAFHILADFDYDESAEMYTFTLDPRWRTLFGNREFALIDWYKRLQIGRGQDMAKTLQRLIATSADPVQRYALDWLKEKMQYASPMRKFKEALTAAVGELQRVGVISNGHIEISTKGREQLVLWRSG
ncbi:plasmid replication initiator TrfA [Chromobacterium vaccinii]|uniref:plasmid replication initiator TrfA n=1 Tax=Chromobacterium vaccinii TaxID=1108595 RepID=UPI000E144A37|nr:plasmid replication initiator TrfA [Chromobacterium vaccinii]SUX54603.1 Uncharacterised protein [Chromobacterium vaccinii]